MKNRYFNIRKIFSSFKERFKSCSEKRFKGVNKNFSKIPNELLEILAKTYLSNYECRCLMVILRKTFGWNKKEDFISLSQFAQKTGIRKNHVWRTLKRLESRKIIKRNEKKISINLNYQEWRGLPKRVTVTKSGINATNLDEEVARIGEYKKHLQNKAKQKKERSFLKRKMIEQLKKEGFVLEGSYLVDKTGNKYKPHFWNNEMRRAKGKWWVLQGGEWFEFAGSEKEIEWRKIRKNKNSEDIKTWP